MATRLRQGQLVRAIFQVLSDAPDGLAVSEIVKRVEALVPPTPAELEDYPNRPGARRFDKTLRFATIGPVKAGWLVKNKGIWLLTEEGRSAYERFPDPMALSGEWNRIYREWKRAQPKPDDDDEGDENGGGSAANTLEESEERAWTEIREYLTCMRPYDFQDLVAALLEAMDYHVLWTAPPGPDRGVDIIAHNDPLGTSSPRIKVQVKRQGDSKVGRDGISSFVGTLGIGDVGIYVSAGGFTADAEREARSQEQRRLTLIDLDRLVILWIEHYDRLTETARQMLPLKPIYFLAPDV